MRNKKNVFGFSLIELLVVIAILGVLAAIAVPQYKRYVYLSKLAPMYTKYAATADAYRLNQAKKGNFNATAPAGQDILAAGDSYLTGWGNLAGSVYSAASCPGSKGGYFVRDSNEYGTYVFGFWFTNTNGVVKTQCVITPYPVAGSEAYATIAPAGCEVLPMNSSCWTATPLATANMAAANCN